MENERSHGTINKITKVEKPERWRDVFVKRKSATRKQD